MTASTTLIRVPSSVRDRVRAVAEQQQSTFGEVIERGLDLIRQERFWSQVAALIPDAAYREEFRAWSDTDMTDEEHTNGQSATR